MACSYTTTCFQVIQDGRNLASGFALANSRQGLLRTGIASWRRRRTKGRAKKSFQLPLSFSACSSDFVDSILDQGKESNLVSHQESIAFTVDTQLFIDMLPVLADRGCGNA